MSLGKKFIASLAAFTLAVSATGCGTGKGTAWSARYENYETSAGMFIYYEMSAYYEATSKAKEADENLDTTDKKALKATVIDGKDMLTWIQDEATDSLRKYLAVQAEFDKRGLELSDEQKAEIKDSVESSWEYYGSVYEQNGIGKETFTKITELSYKSEMLFNSYYAEGGTDEVSIDEIKKYYDENYARVKYINLTLKDTEGNDLDDDGKAERKEMAEKFVERANKGEDFDKLIEEYNDYLAQLTADVAEDAAEEAASVDETTEQAETVEETTSAESEESAETEEILESEEVTVTEAEAANEEVSEETEAASETEEESAETENTEETTSDETEETVLTDETAETEESAETTETDEAEETEEDPYANEKIIKLGSDDSYTPTEKVNKAIFDAEIEKAVLVDDTEAGNGYYVVIRYDILEREDLLEGDSQLAVLSEMMGEDYDEKLLAIVTLEAIEKNEPAYKRYNPFDFEI